MLSRTTSFGSERGFRGSRVARWNVVRERLPFPIVHYPGHYGPFIGFQREGEKNVHLCSCALRAVSGYLRLRLAKPIPANSHPERMFILDGLHFPLDLVRPLMDAGVKNDASVINYLWFTDGLCHRCNQAIPSLRYCNAMYGGVFARTFGWYVAQKSYEYGVREWVRDISIELAPRQVLDAYVVDPVGTREYVQSLESAASEQGRGLFELLSKQARRVGNLIEDEVRTEFGYKKIGDHWVSETMLHRFVCDALPGIEVKKHYRPPFLEGLELDLYIPDFLVGIEYQGEQHFMPIEQWGGEAALHDQQERDSRKGRLCKTAGVHLLYFDFEDELSSELVVKRLRKVRSLRECLSS
jgi:hypothetical protein